MGLKNDAATNGIGFRTVSVNEIGREVAKERCCIVLAKAQFCLNSCSKTVLIWVLADMLPVSV
jgi:hypothetical protein